MTYVTLWLWSYSRHVEPDLPASREIPWVSHESNLLVSRYIKKPCDLERKFSILGIGHYLLAAARVYEYSK